MTKILVFRNNNTLDYWFKKIMNFFLENKLNIRIHQNRIIIILLDIDIEIVFMTKYKYKEYIIGRRDFETYCFAEDSLERNFMKSIMILLEVNKNDKNISE